MRWWEGCGSAWGGGEGSLPAAVEWKAAAAAAAAATTGTGGVGPGGCRDVSSTGGAVLPHLDCGKRIKTKLFFSSVRNFTEEWRQIVTIEAPLEVCW